LSWEDSISGHWWQEVWFDGDGPTFRDIGAIDQKANGNVRATIDRITMEDTLRAISPGRQSAAGAGVTAAAQAEVMASSGAMWRKQIDEILGRAATGAKSDKRVGRRSAPRINYGS
jgi:hypothetical protein